LSAPIDQCPKTSWRIRDGKSAIEVAPSLADLRAFLHRRRDGSTAGEESMRMHCQHFWDFPAFPVFPAESVVLAGNRTRYRLGLAVPSDGTQPDGTQAVSLSRQYERIDDA
jgi:hypothetical protein